MADPIEAPSGFLSRWSRRKSQLRQGAVATAEPERSLPLPAAAVAAPPTGRSPMPATAVPGGSAASTLEPSPVGPPSDPASAVEPAPSLADANALAAGADVRRFVAPDVLPEVRNAALKRLFADPHFNVMDGLDTYIDDYGKPDPLPEGMLRQMAQASFLRLFDDDSPVPPDAALQQKPPDEDPDLRLQPDDAAGPGGPAPGAGPDAGRER